MAAVAAAQMGGGKAVLKMKPAEYERTASIRESIRGMSPQAGSNRVARTYRSAGK
jgi:hypothetical protein